MTVESYRLKLQTRREGEIENITEKVQALLENSKIRIGIAVLFVPGSTAALTTIEYEPGLLHDFPAMLDRIAPSNISYEHEKHWHDGNGHSHVRAALLGPDLTVPIHAGKLVLGTWQQIVFMELDVRPRNREITVQLIGDS
ncbi:MAG TPA: secondary thiamine-phosphate synthase enzyme YjbQ [Candidatus Bathyarchaeia archaeon]|nr:secondary thiamine-phosphate synthase enzyme YjbQ [Candidatus Bathyarchaeia archaeon]